MEVGIFASPSPEDLYIKLTNSEDHPEFKDNKQTLNDVKDMVKESNKF